jgi:hypothetical protein
LASSDGSRAISLPILIKASLTSNWEWVDYNTCCVKSLVFLENKADLIDTLSKSWQLEVITDINQPSIIDIDQSIDNTQLKESIISGSY